MKHENDYTLNNSIRDPKESVKVQKGGLQQAVFHTVDEILDNLAMLDNITSEQKLDSTMPRLLASMGRYAKADRAYLFGWASQEKQILKMTHEWCAKKVRPTIGEMQNVYMEEMPNWARKLKNRENIISLDWEADKKSMPEEHALFDGQDLKALIIIPIFTNNKLSGCIGFDNPTPDKTNFSIRLLASVGGHIGGLQETLRMMRELKEKQHSLSDGLKELNKEKTILDALSIDYTSEYLCDFAEDRLIPIKQTEGSNAGIINETLQEQQFTYSVRIPFYYEKFVMKESAPDFLEKMSAEYLQKYLSEHDRFAYRYRAYPNPDGKQHFEVQLVRLPNTQGRKAVMGFRYIDDVVAEEERQKLHLQKVNNRLEDQLHIISSLANAYFAVYRVDLHTNRCQPIKNIAFFEQVSENCKTTDDVVKAFVTLCVMEEDQEKMWEFTDWRSLSVRLEENDTVVMEFHGALWPWEWCRASWVVASRDKDRKVKEALFAVEDISAIVAERKKIEQERERETLRSQMRVKTMAEAIHGGFKLSKNDGVFTFNMVSEQLAAMLGFDSQEEMMEKGISMMNMVHPDDVKRELPQATKSVKSGQIYTMHYRMRCKDGSWKNVEDRGRLIYNAAGKGEFWSFITDQDELTKKTEALKAANKANEALKRTQQELKLARDAANAANRAKTTFLFNMSHDIRTPMNAIVGYTELLQKHPEDREKCEEYIQKIRSSSDFLLSLINNVLEMARIESGKATLDESPIKAGTILDTVSALFTEKAKKKNITFVRKYDVHQPYIYCDRLKMQEIFLNLLSNAFKYTPEGGKVSMLTREVPFNRDGYVQLQTIISDNGIGMAKDYLPTVFEEFSRERNSTGNKIEGTGLGMAIVKKLVNLMGGTIEVESEPGKGTSFCVTVPHRIALAEEMQKTTAISVDTEQFAGKRILLAEDNDLNAEITFELLKDYGFLIDRAKDGISCVNMLQKAWPGYYDVILMDVQMPNMDGYQATKRIRKMLDPTKGEIPIIAMTANAFEEDRKNALEAGMNDHLAKPIDVTKLLEKLARLLR